MIYETSIYVFRMMSLLLILSFMSTCEYSFDKTKARQSSQSEEMLLEILDNRRYVSPDQLAEIFINQDPSFQIIDVRTTKEYEYFSLPDAVYVSLNEIVNTDMLDCAKRNHIFYSNGDQKAEQAWYLHRIEGCKGGFILKGGLNEWTEIILNPPIPREMDGKEAHDLYAFRKAVGLYLTGDSKALDAEPYVKPTAKKSIVLKPKKVIKASVPDEAEEEEEEEGC